MLQPCPAPSPCCGWDAAAGIIRENGRGDDCILSSSLSCCSLSSHYCLSGWLRGKRRLICKDSSSSLLRHRTTKAQGGRYVGPCWRWSQERTDAPEVLGDRACSVGWLAGLSREIRCQAAGYAAFYMLGLQHIRVGVLLASYFVCKYPNFSRRICDHDWWRALPTVEGRSCVTMSLIIVYLVKNSHLHMYVRLILFVYDEDETLH